MAQLLGYSPAHDVGGRGADLAKSITMARPAPRAITYRGARMLRGAPFSRLWPMAVVAGTVLALTLFVSGAAGDAASVAAVSAGGDLRGADLQRANLRNRDFAGADLRGANLRAADLSEADLTGADLRKADLAGADLRRATLDDANLARAILIGARLRGASLRRTNFADAVLNAARFQRAVLDRAQLVGADLSGAVLTDASLRFANLRGAGLIDADLTGADLTGAKSDRRTAFPAAAALTPRKVASTTAPVAPWNFVVIPDFLNQDIDYPDPDWDPALDYFLDRVAAENPDFVAVPGDVVNGHWTQGGPELVTRHGERYYGAWMRRMRAHKLRPYVAVGDHDVGDNPWPAAKQKLIPLYRDVFSKQLANPGNGPADQKGTVFSVRHKNLQLVSVDVFEQHRPGGPVAIGVTGSQLDWVRRRLATDAPHIVAMGHTPILPASHLRNSSGLTFPGGAGSFLWRALADAGARLYLAGEFHDVSTAERGAVTQIVSGSLAGVANEMNYLLVTVHPDRLDIVLKSIRTDVVVTGLPLIPDDLPPVRVSIPTAAAMAGPQPRGRMTITSAGVSGATGILKSRDRALQ